MCRWIISESIKITLSDIENYISINNINITKIQVDNIIHLTNNINIDSDRLNKCDLKYPIILLKRYDIIETILDGNHRTTKAYRNNIKYINSYIIEYEKLNNNNLKLIFK